MTRMSRLVRSRAGLTLTEVVVATAILVLFTTAILSVVLVSRGMMSTSTRSEPDAAAAQLIVDTIMTNLSRGDTDISTLESNTGALCVNDVGFSPDHANRRQFQFEYVMGDATEAVPGYVIYVRVYAQNSTDSVFLKAFSGVRMPDADGTYGS